MPGLIAEAQHHQQEASPQRPLKAASDSHSVRTAALAPCAAALAISDRVPAQPARAARFRPLLSGRQHLLAHATRSDDFSLLDEVGFSASLPHHPLRAWACQA